MIWIVMCFGAANASHVQTASAMRLPEKQLEALLDDLGDPAYEVRQEAVKKLYAAGPAVLGALADIRDGDDFEAALRARDLIERIQKLFFVGAKIELSASHKQFRWDEPISLRVKVNNPSDFAIHLPFLIQNRESIDADRLAVQMGNMLDAADFLSIVGPDEKPVELQVDDIRGQPSLEAALDTRVYAEPASLLAPRSEFVLQLPAFNRGLARYRMLHKGPYRLQFAYVPEWDDEKMRTDGIGRVLSNKLTLAVTSSAPNLILHASREIGVSLHVVGRDIVVRVTNTHDRPIGVNLNIGGKEHRDHGHLEWRWSSPTGLIRAAQRMVDAPPLDAKNLMKLKSGKSVDIFNCRLNELFTLQGFEHMKQQPGKIKLAVQYTNVLDRSLLISRIQKDKPPDARKWQELYEAMPLPTFVGSRTSEFVEISLENTEER